MICANSLTSGGAGFGSETNIITMITQNGEEALEKNDQRRGCTYHIGPPVRHLLLILSSGPLPDRIFQ